MFACRAERVARRRACARAGARYTIFDHSIVCHSMLRCDMLLNVMLNHVCACCSFLLSYLCFFSCSLFLHLPFCVRCVLVMFVLFVVVLLSCAFVCTTRCGHAPPAPGRAEPARCSARAL